MTDNLWGLYEEPAFSSYIKEPKNEDNYMIDMKDLM
jgi:hypothetical protein